MPPPFDNIDSTDNADSTDYIDAFGHLALRERMAPELPAELLAHIDRVVALAGPLARRHGAGEARVLLAAQGHDLLRALPDAELLRRAEAHGLLIEPVERSEPVLLHGPLGALELEARFAITDTTVLDAVRWHTTGHPDFGPEAWAVFIADKVEPQKLERWPALATVAARARDSLEAAALHYLDLSAQRALREGWALHPLAARTATALRRRLSA